MIEHCESDMFADGCEALVNTVNCVGVMGRGIALAFKEKFPENFKAYKKACDSQEVVPGKVFVYDTGSLLGPRWILNFPTKRHWRGGSRLADIEDGLVDLKRVIVEKKIKSVSVPPLGCGLGGLDWNVVRPMIERELEGVSELRVCLHSPAYKPDDKPVVNVKPIEMRPGRAALVLVARDYLARAIDPVLTLLKVHKMMYFLQVRGEKLNLNYVKFAYGPYADNLRHFLMRTEGHLLYGFRNAGDDPHLELHLVPSACEDAAAYIKNCPDTARRIREVGALTDGFESNDGMELLATVHWVCTREGADTRERAYELVHAWNRHKQQFSEHQVNAAYDRLREQKWI